MTGALILVAVLVLSAPASGVGHAPASEAVDLIVLFRHGVTRSERERVMRQFGSGPTRHFRHVPASAGRADAHARRILERHPDVLSVVPDRPVQKLGVTTSSGLATAVQVVPAGVTRIGAQPGAQLITGSDVGVAIVDTGIDFQHADLTVAEACFTAYAACQDDEGHGTHVAGIVAAKDNDIDVVGVAPRATLYAVKVLDRHGRGADSTVMAGLDWIAQNATLVSPQIRVVNMSLGRTGTLDDNPALHASVQALTAAGLTVIVAAGNDSALEVNEQVPATYPEVVAVASTTATPGVSLCAEHPTSVMGDTASFFTTDGAFDPTTGIGVNVSAPGEEREDITESCFVESIGILSTQLGGGLVRMSGTSMAAPHVSGVVALMAEQSVVMPDDVRRRLRRGADGLDTAPVDSPADGYSFDGEREGVVSASGALSTP